MHIILKADIDHTGQKKKMDDAKGLAIAFEEAKISYDEGGIPVRLPRALPALCAAPRGTKLHLCRKGRRRGRGEKGKEEGGGLGKK